MGRIERPPSWILKYKERIEKGTITVEEILEEENKTRSVPIKRSSVTRAINSMGYPITSLQRGEEEVEAEEKREEEKEAAETSKKPEKGPEWLQKYRKRIEKGTITVEEILEEENKIRSVPIKKSSVTRAINSMGYQITSLQRGKEEEAEEKREEEKEAVETSKKPEKGPEWLQKYRKRIEKGTITVEEILEEENKIRAVPIKRSSVTRAINSMGYQIISLQRGKEEEAEEKREEEKRAAEIIEKPERAEKGPGWLQKYRERIEKGTITVEEILEEENKIRAMPIKRSSVTRAINSIGYPIIGLRRERAEEVKELGKVKKAAEAEAGVSSSIIGKISEETAKRFNAVRKSWEEDLGKPLQNDYFLNILLALAKLVEHGKVLALVKK